MANHILVFLLDEALAKKDLALKLGKSKPSRYLNDLVSKMTDVGMIEYTIPDKPGSRLQKYRITLKGKAWLDARNPIKQ
jgi:ATP-dependent DNA helicase RecG